MLKTVGLCLIIVSGAGIGFSKSRELTLRVQALEKILQMVILLKGEIRYGNASLYDAFTGAAAKLPGEYGAFLYDTAKEIENKKGESFSGIFRRTASAHFKSLGLLREEQEQLFSLGEHLGYLDLDMQIKQLEAYEKEVERSAEALKRELPEKKKVYRSLGILLGILLAVLVY